MDINVCARGGCTASAARTFCSRRCAALDRVGRGWKPHETILRPEVRVKALHKAGIVTAERRRKARRLEIVAQLVDLIPARIRETFEPAQLAAVKALLARGYLQGKVDGYRAGLHIARKPKPGEAA